jgi:hypothetical protein
VGVTVGATRGVCLLFGHLHQVITRCGFRETPYSAGNLNYVKLFQRMDLPLLRQVIRQRIQDGRLPRTPLIELGHGLGIRQACDACGSIIAKNQRMTVRISADDWRTLRLHDDCFQIWDTERPLDVRVR